MQVDGESLAKMDAEMHQNGKNVDFTLYKFLKHNFRNIFYAFLLLVIEINRKHRVCVWMTCSKGPQLEWNRCGDGARRCHVQHFSQQSFHQNTKN